MEFKLHSLGFSVQARTAWGSLLVCAKRCCSNSESSSLKNSTSQHDEDPTTKHSCAN